jgi:hypothetical protein
VCPFYQANENKDEKLFIKSAKEDAFIKSGLDSNIFVP